MTIKSSNRGWNCRRVSTEQRNKERSRKTNRNCGLWVHRDGSGTRTRSNRNSLDDTKRAIKKTVSEAKREIARYTETMAELQQETIQATKEIGYNSIELQKEAVSLIPKFQERFMSYYVPWAYPKLVTEYYSKMVDNFVDERTAW